MAEKKLNVFLRHKRLIIIGLVLIGLFVMILLTYILTYANNKPKAFKDDKDVKFVKKCAHFDFHCFASDLSLKKVNGKSQYIKLTSEITNVKQTISNVTVTYELHSNWTNKSDYTSDSEHSFNNGEKLHTGSSIYSVGPTSITLSNPYPIKVLPLVKVKSPIVYAKVTYSITVPSINGSTSVTTKTVYFSFTYNQYVENRTVIN